MNPVLKSILRLSRRFGIELSRYDHASRMAGDSDYAVQQLLGSDSVKTVFDVGANTGQSAALYRRLFPKAMIHSFEPAGKTHAELAAAVSGDSLVRTWQLALSDQDGTSEFFVSADPTCSSLLEPSNTVTNADLQEKLQAVGKERVQCSRLDTFCEEQSITQIDLLKMDIQGAELQAIRGAARMLSGGKIRAVFCEVLFSPLYQNACDFELISQAMKESGYKLYGLYNLYHFGGDGLLWGDAIFVHPDLLAARR